MSERVEIGGLGVAKELHDLIRDEIAPGTGIEPEAFWHALADIVRDLGSKHRALLERRDRLQSQIDTWHVERAHSPSIRSSTAPSWNLSATCSRPEMRSGSRPRTWTTRSR